MASRAPGDDETRAPLEAIAAGIAHEVRNPLNALQINLSILAQELSEIVPRPRQPGVRGDHGDRVRSTSTFRAARPRLVRYSRGC
jgi:signal transduction histidine kinase